MRRIRDAGDNLILPAMDLRLGDTVSPTHDDNGSRAYETATVVQIKDGRIYLFRPYATTADFSYTGGVIPYIGIEQYDIAADRQPYIVHSRKDLK